MVVLSVGMRKSGTGWYFNMTNDLLQAAGGQDVHQIRNMPSLRSIIRGNNCKVGELTVRKLVRLTLPHFTGHTYVVKTHAGPSISLRAFTATGTVKVTYQYRDPRDIVLSALEHAEAARRAGIHIDLVRLNTLDDSIQMVKRELARWEHWMRHPRVLKVRYEDLIADTMGELRRLVDFLSLDVPEASLQAIVQRYQKKEYAKTLEQPIIGNRLHFNKGIPGRFREEMSPQARALCERHLGPYLRKMGYA
ncbi:MAG: sulfotransferase domain-containing protein [Rhodothermales bacterium]